MRIYVSANVEFTTLLSAFGFRCVNPFGLSDEKRSFMTLVDLPGYGSFQGLLNGGINLKNTVKFLRTNQEKGYNYESETEQESAPEFRWYRPGSTGRIYTTEATTRGITGTTYESFREYEASGESATSD